MVAHTLSVASGIANVRFVGRGHELRALADAYAGAVGEDASLVVVGSDAGVGKTRLLAEFTGGLDAIAALPGGPQRIQERHAAVDGRGRGRHGASPLGARIR